MTAVTLYIELLAVAAFICMGVSLWHAHEVGAAIFAFLLAPVPLGLAISILFD